MDYFNDPRANEDINIELKDFIEDESHPYANREEIASYETLHRKNNFDEQSDEHVYADTDVYENTRDLRRDPITRVNTLTRGNEENEYATFEPRLDEPDMTYDTLDKQEKERASTIYSTLTYEDETLRPGSIVGVYKNLKYVRSKRDSCFRRRWKLLLLLAIVLLVSITGVITAVVLVTNEEDPVEFTENFDTPMESIEGCGSGSNEDGSDAELTSFD